MGFVIEIVQDFLQQHIGARQGNKQSGRELCHSTAAALGGSVVFSSRERGRGSKSPHHARAGRVHSSAQSANCIGQRIRAVLAFPRALSRFVSDGEAFILGWEATPERLRSAACVHKIPVCLVWRLRL